MADAWTGHFEKLDDNRWLIPRTYKKGMLTDGIIYVNERSLPQVIKDAAPEQVANVACLPGIVGRSIAMPDIHWGYGFPIGGVAAMHVKDGVVSPGGVGYDINCGVRLMRTNLTIKDIKPRIKELIDQIFRDVPVGMRDGGIAEVNKKELQQVLRKGAQWMAEHDYGTQDDINHSEELGCLSGADPNEVSERAMERGQPQLGSLGSGNHFLEIQTVEQIYNPTIAQAFGIYEKGQITIMMHTGSRGLGHQICSEQLDLMQSAIKRYQLDLPDRQLACAPIQSPEGQSYLAAMACAANYAWANRQAIAYAVKKAFERVLGVKAASFGFTQIYDVAHNIAKFEEHEVNGIMEKLLIHRKGATRSYGAGHPEAPIAYRAAGQPVLVPGDMGRYSYLLVGTDGALKETWGSTCHGAGRLMSRHAAMKQAAPQSILRELDESGILVRAQNKKLIAEEAPHAYKNVDDVVNVAEAVGISQKVCRLKPLAVIKG